MGTLPEGILFAPKQNHKGQRSSNAAAIDEFEIRFSSYMQPVILSSVHLRHYGIDAPSDCRLVSM